MNKLFKRNLNTGTCTSFDLEKSETTSYFKKSATTTDLCKSGYVNTGHNF